MYVSFNRMWYNKKQAVKKTGRGSYRKWKGKKMKKKLKIKHMKIVFLKNRKGNYE